VVRLRSDRRTDTKGMWRESSAKAALEPVVPASSDRFRGRQKSRHKSESGRWGNLTSPRNDQWPLPVADPMQGSHSVGSCRTHRHRPPPVKAIDHVRHPPCPRWGRRGGDPSGRLPSWRWQVPMGAARISSSRPTTTPSAGRVLGLESPATRPLRPPRSQTRSSHESDVGSWDPVNALLGCLG
jgi:hypothetical protein